MGKKKKGKQTGTQSQKHKQVTSSLLSIVLTGLGLNRREDVAFTHLTTIHYLAAILIFLTAFFCYLKTLTPDIGFHDSGDMITSSFLLGICHPPGYPLYNLIGKLLISSIPIGNIAYRMNLFAALAASLAVMMVFLVVVRIGMRQGNNPLLSLIPGLSSALVLCFSKTFWEQAVVAEKYTLNALFVSLLIFLLIKWQEAMAKAEDKHHRSILFLFSLIFGFSFTHHMQSIFLLPASIYLVIVTFWKHKHSLPEIKLLIRCFCLFLLPLCLYLYLPLRSASNPALNWGSPHTLPYFIDYITLQAYKHFFISQPAIWFKNLYHHLSHFFTNQFTLWLIPFGLFGLFFLLQHRLLTGIFLLLIALTDILHSIRYGISNIEDYYIPCFVIFSICVGFCLAWLISRLKWIAALCLLLPFLPLLANYFHCNHSQYYFARDLGRGLLQRMQDRAVLFLKGDVNGFPVWYLHLVENQRSDVSLVDTPFLFQNWYAEQIKSNYPQLRFNLFPKNEANELGLARFYDLVKGNYEQYPLYHYSDEPMPRGYSTVPVWFFSRIIQSDLNQEQGMAEGRDEIILRGALDKSISKDAKAKDVIRNCAGGYNNRGNTYLGMGLYDEAILELNKALRLDTSLPVLYYNLGRAYSAKGMEDKAVINFKRVLEIEPGYPGIHLLLAGLYEKMGQIDEAIVQLKQEASLTPKVELYQALARLYYGQGNLNEVILQCQQILKLQPNNIEARRNLASLYFKQGRFNEAKAEFKNLLILLPSDQYSQQMLEQIKRKQ